MVARYIWNGSVAVDIGIDKDDDGVRWQDIGEMCCNAFVAISLAPIFFIFIPIFTLPLQIASIRITISKPNVNQRVLHCIIHSNEANRIESNWKTTIGGKNTLYLIPTKMLPRLTMWKYAGFSTLSFSLYLLSISFSPSLCNEFRS